MAAACFTLAPLLGKGMRSGVVLLGLGVEGTSQLGMRAPRGAGCGVGRWASPVTMDARNAKIEAVINARAVTNLTLRLLRT